MPSKMTEYAGRVLAGDYTIDQVPEQIRPSVAHLILLPIYKMACEVLDVVGADAELRAEARNRKLSRVPELLRPQVKAEAERVFNYRRSLK